MPYQSLLIEGRTDRERESDQQIILARRRRRSPRLGGRRNPRTGAWFGTGWRPDPLDLRDYRPEDSERFGKALKQMNLTKATTASKKLPKTMDLRKHCSPIENQGAIGSCTAHAVTGLAEYFQRRVSNNHIEGARLFLYKATRNLMGEIGDTGAYIRSTMGALQLCGLPPEDLWPYSDHPDDFDIEPDAFVYAVGENYQSVSYYCHDPYGDTKSSQQLLNQLRSFLAAGLPFAFGFYGFATSEHSDVEGGFAVPGERERVQWGHAVMAVGYNDSKKIKNLTTGKTSTGALLIRNSWGLGWGEDGYGWLPYDYVHRGLASDYWSLLKQDWVDTKVFGL